MRLGLDHAMQIFQKRMLQDSLEPDQDWSSKPEVDAQLATYSQCLSRSVLRLTCSLGRTPIGGFFQ